MATGSIVRTLAFIVVIGLVSVLIVSRGTAQQIRPASSPAATANMSIDDALKAFRADLQSSRADTIAKNVTLTSEQAAKFWPAFEQYQKAQNVIMDEQLQGVKRYAESYETLTDGDAMSLMKAHLERDARMTALRQKWLGEFQKVLPARLAALVMQIDRRISLAQQIQISSQIPLVH